MLGSTINIHQRLMDGFGSCWSYCLFVGVVNVAFFPYVSSPSCSLAPRSMLGTSILPSREKQHRCHSINGNARVPARCQSPFLNHHFCPQQHYRMEFRFVRLAEVSRALPQLRLPVTVDPGVKAVNSKQIVRIFNSAQRPAAILPDQFLNHV